jgi:Spy/CpxP family protein refolding chaperone
MGEFRMFNFLYVNRVKFAYLLLCLCAAPALAGIDNKPLASEQTPARVQNATRLQSQAPGSTNEFAGLTLTEEQKAKVDKIHLDIRSRMAIVAKDPAETAEQKEAMFEGLVRMERDLVFQILTPEQKAEVRNKNRVKHAAEKARRQPPATLQQPK